MRRADFRKEGFLYEKNFVLIFQKKKNLIMDLLKISNAEDFFEVFDQDRVNKIIIFTFSTNE
jgi:hypothetical protein